MVSHCQILSPGTWCLSLYALSCSLAYQLELLRTGLASDSQDLELVIFYGGTRRLAQGTWAKITVKAQR